MAGAFSCVRPGCSAPARATLTYDYAAQAVWLDDPGDPWTPGLWGICVHHADRLRAPKGWTCQDRRCAPIRLASPLAV
ncbi:MAG: DUF3499 family protein [Acidimicrobiales bacterium]